MSQLIQFNSDDFKTYEVIDSPSYGGDYAKVNEAGGFIFVVVVDYEEYDSCSRGSRTDFVDAFSSIEKAEQLALAITEIMKKTTERDFGSWKEKQGFGIDYENDVGDTVRCALSKWFSWGSSFNNVAIVTSEPGKLRAKGVIYR